MVAFPSVVDVRARVVAAPWERDALGRCVAVGREADVRPEAGPLELYLSAFPHRYVLWNVERQLWEIRQVNPESGADERVEFLFYYDAPPDETGHVWSEEELAQMIGSNDRRLVKCYQPFDYEFVRQRIRDRFEFHAEGAARLTDRRMARNRRRQMLRMTQGAQEMEYLLKHDRRWLGVLERAQRQKERGDPRPMHVILRKLQDERTPLKMGGITN